MLAYHQSKIATHLIGEVLKKSNLTTQFNFLNHSFHLHISTAQRTACLLSIKKYEFSNVIPERHMAGHAKWQNVLHIKQAKDRQKTLMCNKYAFLIRFAIKEGGPDPKLNNKLGSLINEAKKNNVPFSVVESALKKAGEKKNLKLGSIEILGPGGIIVVLEYETDNISTMRHEIKTICKKYGANVFSGEGRWRAVYEQKGIIKVVGEKTGQPLNAENALDAAIEAGAEEVHTRENDGNVFLEFYCAPDDLHPVKKELEGTYNVEEGYIGYLPTVTVQLSEEDTNLVDSFLDDLGSMPEVIKIYENVE